jgi:rRNA processing protein Krr1/Pno1
MYDLADLVAGYLIKAIGDYTANGWITKAVSDLLDGACIGFDIDKKKNAVRFYLRREVNGWETKSYFLTRGRNEKIVNFDEEKTAIADAFTCGIIMMMSPIDAVVSRYQEA